MVLILTGALALLAFVILLYVIALTAGRVLQSIRARRHVGVYRVRIGPPDARGYEGDDLDDDFPSVSHARQAGRDELVGGGPAGHVAFILAERDDGEWDVVDRIDVLE